MGFFNFLCSCFKSELEDDKASPLVDGENETNSPKLRSKSEGLDNISLLGNPLDITMLQDSVIPITKADTKVRNFNEGHNPSSPIGTQNTRLTMEDINDNLVTLFNVQNFAGFEKKYNESFTGNSENKLRDYQVKILQAILLDQTNQSKQADISTKHANFEKSFNSVKHLFLSANQTFFTVKMLQYKFDTSKKRENIQNISDEEFSFYINYFIKENKEDIFNNYIMYSKNETKVSNKNGYIIVDMLINKIFSNIQLRKYFDETFIKAVDDLNFAEKSKSVETGQSTYYSLSELHAGSIQARDVANSLDSFESLDPAVNLIDAITTAGDQSKVSSAVEHS